MSNHLEITLTAGCPMMCSYCPQGNYIKNYSKTNLTNKKMMTLDDYKIILSNVDKHIQEIFFTGFTEPLSNPEWYDIVKYTRDAGYKTHLNTTLFGATSEKIDKMVSLEGVPIRIHLTDSKVVIPEEIYLEFSQKYKMKLQFDSFTEEGIQKLPISLRGKELKHIAHSRADNLDIEHTIINGPVGCAGNRFYSNVVLPNGDVSVCCSDFSLKHILGNLLTTKLKDIHSGEKMVEFMKMMGEGDPSFICNNCFYALPLGK